MSQLHSMTDAFWNGRNTVGVPPGWEQKISAEDGFRIQIGVQDRHTMEGDARIGWKVAATSPAVQQQLGLNEPAFGSLRRSRNFQDGYQMSVTAHVQPHAECELCFEIDDSVAEARSPDDIRAGIVRCFPAFELIEKRIPVSEFGAAMADNAEHTAIVLGKPIDDLDAMDFATVRCTLFEDDREVGTASGDAVLGDPLNSIWWLKKRLEQYGQVLPSGSLIMTGSFMRQHLIRPGTKLTARFSGVGTVSVFGKA